MKRPKLLFMGTPEFAVPSLNVLIKSDFNIVGVVTQPDRPKGRGREVSPSPVKTLAESHGLAIYQPEKVKSRDFLNLFHHISPDIVVVSAFGQILPKEILESAKMGCINVHPSLLPKYRGAAPINWTLIRGETKTGVTIMFMDEGLDTGDILLQEETSIQPEETYGELHNRLAELGASLLMKTLSEIVNSTFERIPQDSSLATYAPRISTVDALIQWDLDFRDVLNLIRGLSPVPCAFTFLKGKKLKIFKASAEGGIVAEGPGKVGRLTEKGLPVSAKGGLVYLREVQIENKKRMDIQDFLRGFPISPGDVLG